MQLFLRFRHTNLMEVTGPVSERRTERKQLMDNRVYNNIRERDTWNRKTEEIIQQFVGPLSHEICFDPASVEYFGRILEQIKGFDEKVVRIQQTGATHEDVAETRERVRLAAEVFSGKNEDLKEFMAWLRTEQARQSKAIGISMTALDREIETNMRLKRELEHLESKE